MHVEVLERAKDPSNDTELDDGNLAEIAVDRPVIPELGAMVQTRAADGEDWSPLAVVVQVGEDQHLGELKIAGSEGPKAFTNPHWAPNQPTLMRRAPDPKKKADAKFGSGDGDSTDDISGKAKLRAAKSLMVDLDVEGRVLTGSTGRACTPLQRWRTCARKAWAPTGMDTCWCYPTVSVGRCLILSEPS